MWCGSLRATRLSYRTIAIRNNSEGLNFPLTPALVVRHEWVLSVGDGRSVSRSPSAGLLQLCGVWNTAADTRSPCEAGGGLRRRAESPHPPLLLMFLGSNFCEASTLLSCRASVSSYRDLLCDIPYAFPHLDITGQIRWLRICRLPYIDWYLSCSIGWSTFFTSLEALHNSFWNKGMTIEAPLYLFFFCVIHGVVSTASGFSYNSTTDERRPFLINCNLYSRPACWLTHHFSHSGTVPLHVLLKLRATTHHLGERDGIRSHARILISGARSVVAFILLASLPTAALNRWQKANNDTGTLRNIVEHQMK